MLPVARSIIPEVLSYRLNYRQIGTFVGRTFQPQQRLEHQIPFRSKVDPLDRPRCERRLSTATQIKSQTELSETVHNAILILSLFGNAYAYISQNPFHQEWVDRIRDLMEIRDNSKRHQLNEAHRNLRMANKLLEGMDRLEEQLSNKKLKEFFKDTIEHQKTECDKQLAGQREGSDKEVALLNKAIYSLEEVVKFQRNSLKETHEKELGKQEETHKKEKTELEAIHQKAIRELADTYKLEKTKLETTNQELNDKLKTYQHVKDTQESEQLSLYKKCKDSQCLIDLHKYLSGGKSVNFEWAALSPECVQLLKEALEKNLHPFTTTLDFNNSYIVQNEGLIHLMQGFKQNTTIEQLSLEKTNAGKSDPDKKHIKAIASMLESNKKLIELTLSGTHFNDTDADTLKEAIQRNKHSALKLLNLSNTYVHEPKKEELRGALKIRVL